MSLFTRTDVTAVKFYKNLIVAGIGCYAYIFDKISTKFLQRLQCLKGQKIYGFVRSKSDDKIIVFGGKQFTVLCSVEDNVLKRSFEPIICADWIHCAVWINEDMVALLTAHNVVQKWSTTLGCLQCEYSSADKTILYCGWAAALAAGGGGEGEGGEGVLVLAGTVSSGLTVHCCGKTLHTLRGHRGAIFSVSCNPDKEVIVTTSDDRSVRIWNIHNEAQHQKSTKMYWANATIVCNHEIYGHSARVMKNCIANHYIISVGEDSVICFWNVKGNLMKQMVTHHSGGIWSVDVDREHVVTGGSDSGIMMHPLTAASHDGTKEVLNIGEGVPKKIVFTARRNIVIMNDDKHVIYYDTESDLKTIYKLNHESTYKLLSISSCKQILAVADMSGKLDVFVENCKDTPYLQGIIDTKLQIGKVLSMQWAGNRHLVFCTENGLITVLASKGNSTEVFSNFVLPVCKERWVTASSIDNANNTLVVGDRCGNVHIYVKDDKNPVKTFKKVHGRYGPTSIIMRNNNIVTTGRDGTIKYFKFNHDTSQIIYMCSKEVEFQWAEKFLDRKETIICGFHERVFVVYDVSSNRRLVEVSCGGGHRAWDCARYFRQLDHHYEQFIKLIYVKNSEIHSVTYQLDKIVSKTIINGSHSKEINCLKIFKPNFDEKTYYFSGGEDTTLRISSTDADFRFQDETIFKHLSSVRTVKIHPITDNELLVISAGGRAQISIKLVKFNTIKCESTLSAQEIVNYFIKGSDKERKGHQNWRNCSLDFDPETRIMDLDILKVNDSEIVVFTGCSDAFIRIFQLKLHSNIYSFEMLKKVAHHKTCILKTSCIEWENKVILVTCTTRGDITFWDTKHLISCDDNKPIFFINTNKSGINSFASRVLSIDEFLIATGGDDNAIHLVLLKLQIQRDLTTISVADKWCSDKLHSSQITGLQLVDNLMISTSIDQRITVYEWRVTNRIECTFISQSYSDVADIQGMDVVECTSVAVSLCVYGKGLELMCLPLGTAPPQTGAAGGGVGKCQ